MFDNKLTTSQSSINTDETDKTITPQINPIINKATDIPAPFQPKKNNQEPEDIFGNSDPIDDSSTENQSKISSTDNLQINNSSVSSVNDNPPPVFKKIPDIKENENESINTTVSDESIPSMPIAPAPTTKKNIIILIAIIILILGLSVGAYWFFIIRQNTSVNISNINSPISSIEDSNVAPIVKETEKKTTQKSTQKNKTEIKDIKDTDGDGLYDEAELLLGTSINSPDTDNDGLFDKDEVKIYKTDPLKPDTDNDGWFDGEEVKNRSNPLDADSIPQAAGHYINNKFKLEFILLDNMVFEGDDNNILRFNDDTDQIKFYIYLNNSQPKDLTPDITYFIDETNAGKLIIKNSQQHEDNTPYSTDLITNSYQANNGLTYLIRYVATKRADNHSENFEKFLQSFIFKK